MSDDASAAAAQVRAAGAAADAPAAHDERLAAVFARARVNVARRISALRVITDSLQDGRPDAVLRAAAVREAHTLAGTAGTFGLGRISELASQLEHLLGSPAGNDPRCRRAGSLVQQMTDALAPEEAEGR